MMVGPAGSEKQCAATAQIQILSEFIWGNQLKSLHSL